ncbi:DUF124-domain-containing protein [Eremomyces bilateralis CBS 781.70]|uniref:Altered inheritance of mitochondria protein 24, mitochondrial n=1 Tax=Eremomyces bilateralis CBS 781.70 TaxID=1392243 RepID=A0A6G1G3K9_9PEZI|nr:DUF124-domain-containing protein [Eremomyces bilateralis CBS 781.70]KAF1812399.1 DUF124-domain-containing protein [Eremomyces bilateralis CBS 781.70]
MSGQYYPPPPEKGGYTQDLPHHPAPQQQFSPPPQAPPGQQQQYYPPPPPSSGGHPPPGYPPPPNQPPQQQYGEKAPGGYASPPPHQQYGAPPPQATHPGHTPSPVPVAQPPQSQQAPMNMNAPGAMPGGAPPAQHFVGAHTNQDDVGTFNGGSYRISHRDTNSILTLQLAMGCPLTAKPGAMIAMSPTLTLKGDVSFSMKKLIVGGSMTSSQYTGPGELLLCGPALGDITNIRLNGNEQWSVGKDAFLACTQGVIKEYKSQGFTKAMFSGEGLFVFKISGNGIMWITSFGAIVRKDVSDIYLYRDDALTERQLQNGEKYIVDNGHLVAWNCKYVLERVASGGLISGMASAEGLVCKFTGPGSIFFQTRNPQAFAAYVTANSAGAQ